MLDMEGYRGTINPHPIPIAFGLKFKFQGDRTR